MIRSSDWSREEGACRPRIATRLRCASLRALLGRGFPRGPMAGLQRSFGFLFLSAEALAFGSHDLRLEARGLFCWLAR
jgi:hypothetical protein